MVERIIHSADRLEVIEALKEMPDLILAEIAGLSDSALRYRPAQDQWSVKEVVGHLRDGAEVWAKRIYQVYAQNDPLFVPYDGEAYVRDRGYQDRDPVQVVEEMRQFRLQTVETLGHAVDWTRVGQWPGVGRRSLKQLAQALLEAERDHIDQVRALKQATATAAAPAAGS